MSLRPLALFDLDGTLVDSAGDLTAAVNEVRAQLTLSPVSVAQVRGAISSGGRAILASGIPEVAEAERESRLDAFLAIYRDKIGYHGGLFTGIAEVLSHIEAAGSRWGVVTNKREDLARVVLERLGLAGRCSVLIGGDTLPRCKPDPLPVVTACEWLEVLPSRAVFIGDDARDVAAGSGAGARTIAVRWGFHPAGDDPGAWGADAVVDSASDLLAPGALYE
ncbi:HAD-IA family hydrolase [Xanthomonadaceae bacterium JHOS43]|nr:HAD-IA family hydrolase [Xanthomonadaceae bacterium JHOS43]